MQLPFDNIKMQHQKISNIYLCGNLYLVLAFAFSSHSNRVNRGVFSIRPDVHGVLTGVDGVGGCLEHDGLTGVVKTSNKNTSLTGT